MERARSATGPLSRAVGACHRRGSSWARAGRLARAGAALAAAAALLGAWSAGAADPYAAELLRAQNAVRAGVRPRPRPPLPALTWSAKAASSARAWAKECRYEHNPRLRALGLGENIAAFTPAGNGRPSKVVALWAAEARSYDPASNSCRSGEICGHYTQLVWRTSTQVGCARQVCSRNSPFPGGRPWELWVCDYAPAGNVIGRRPY